VRPYSIWRTDFKRSFLYNGISFVRIGDAILFLAMIMSLGTAPVFYVMALRAGLGAKRWGALALLMGPFLLPMFVTHKRLRRLQASSPGGVYWYP